jgi:hypothetical protein
MALTAGPAAEKSRLGGNLTARWRVLWAKAIRAADWAGGTMSVLGTSSAASIGLSRDLLDAPHVHEWELRDVEFDSWGQVSYYECIGCPGVRYV